VPRSSALAVDNPQRELITATRRVLGDLQLLARDLSLAAETQDTLRQAIHQLDEVFLLVVVGEFNSGKSAFINALLGTAVLEEGVTPTTAHIHVLAYGETPTHEILDQGLHRLTAPVESLRDIAIVDTPGTNAVLREHEALTTQFGPRSDLVLFVTSADRPFAETERRFLEQIRAWGKKVVLIINKIDLLAREEDVAEVVDFVGESAKRLFGIVPAIFPVSAREALRAKRGEPARWTSSGFQPLEEYLHTTLDDRERLRLKLLNPLGIGTALLKGAGELILARETVLTRDIDALGELERQLSLYERDMAGGFELRMAAIDAVIIKIEQRGDAFFEDMFRLARVMDLMNKGRMQQAFEQQVIGDTARDIERHVRDLIDWLVEADVREWASVSQLVNERRRQHDRFLADSDDVFRLDRARMIDHVARTSQQVVDTYDKHTESGAIADGARVAVATAAALGAGAVGLGTLVTIVASTAAADISGIFMAGALAVIGALVIPAKRQRAKAEMRRKLAVLREQLSGSLRTQFQTELRRSAQRIRDSLAGYSRFVRAESEKVTNARERMRFISESIDRLRTQLAAADN
jgi:small GTP-binding protein